MTDVPTIRKALKDFVRRYGAGTWANAEEMISLLREEAQRLEDELNDDMSQQHEAP